jgi:hypothetical protein
MLGMGFSFVFGVISSGLIQKIESPLPANGGSLQL